MRSFLLNSVLCTAALSASSMAAEQPEQHISQAGSQASIVGPEQMFTGAARIDPLFPGTDEINASGAYVTFEPGARPASRSPRVKRC